MGFDVFLKSYRKISVFSEDFIVIFYGAIATIFFSTLGCPIIATILEIGACVQLWSTCSKSNDIYLYLSRYRNILPPTQKWGRRQRSILIDYLIAI